MIELCCEYLSVRCICLCVLITSRTRFRVSEPTLTVKESSDKRSIMATFVITFIGKFSSMQLIYGEKTRKSLCRTKFSTSFCLSYNESHYSNKRESCTVTEKIEVNGIHRKLWRKELHDIDVPLQLSLLNCTIKCVQKKVQILFTVPVKPPVKAMHKKLEKVVFSCFINL